MDSTTFPTRPTDVTALTTMEFVFDLDLTNEPSLEEVCRRFGNDANRALVWMIRFRALSTWCGREDIMKSLHVGSRTVGDVYEVAASFELNDRWEFDSDAFCAAVDVIASRNGRASGRTE